MELQLPTPVNTETSAPRMPEVKIPEDIMRKVKEWTEKGKHWLAKLWGKTEQAPREVLEEVEAAPQLEDELVKTPIESKQDQQNRNGQKLEVPGLPDKYKVEDFPEDPKPLLAHDFKFLIEENRWELNCRENQNGLYVDIKPKQVGGIVEKEGIFVDTNLAQYADSGDVELKPNAGYTNILPLGYQEGIVYRGVYAGEMKGILENGKIKTRGDAVQNIERHQGLTFFTDLPDLAEGYTTKGGRVQGAYYPSFDQPNYIISIRKPAQVDFEGSSGEVGISREISLSEIVGFVEVRPYVIKQGIIPLKTYNGRVRPSQGEEAMQNPLQMDVAYRIVNVEELKTKMFGGGEQKQRAQK
jgi:hypothetical protein